MRFVVDAMFGTLAKWLRVLGFDTIFARDLDDNEIMALADREDRIIITRDKELAGRSNNCIFLNSDVLDEQISQVLERHPADESRTLTRCLECNTLLVPVEKAEVRDVPDGVLEKEDEFRKCPDCGKFYWPATHWENMMEKVEGYLPKRPRDPSELHYRFS